MACAIEDLVDWPAKPEIGELATQGDEFRAGAPAGVDPGERVAGTGRLSAIANCVNNRQEFNRHFNRQDFGLPAATQ